LRASSSTGLARRQGKLKCESEFELEANPSQNRQRQTACRRLRGCIPVSDDLFMPDPQHRTPKSLGT